MSCHLSSPTSFLSQYTDQFTYSLLPNIYPEYIIIPPDLTLRIHNVFNHTLKRTVQLCFWVGESCVQGR